jgi:hypothetical protein
MKLRVTVAWRRLIPAVLLVAALSWFAWLNLGFVVARSPVNGVLVAVEWNAQSIFFYCSK